MTHPIPDDALDSDVAIIARKGSGKSYLARGLAERLLDLQRRMVVIDPLGAWWGLRSSADGESAGYAVAVFGGEHADMPLTETMGEPLAKLIAGENLPCVIDTSLMRKEEQGRLAIDLFEGLFRFNKDALTIILEEADVFAPQNPSKDGYAAKVLHEVDRIARRGRARGLRLISLTQRPARLHKDVLSQAATLVAMRLTSPHDQTAIEDWIKGNADSSQAKEVMASLATLPVGSGWIWAPDLDMLKKVAFPRIKTLDTSATPKAGETRVEPKTLAQVDVSAIREALKVPEPEAKKQAQNTTRNITAELAAEYQRGLAEGIERGKSFGASVMLAAVQTTIGNLRVPGVIEANREAPLGASPRTETAPAHKAPSEAKTPAQRAQSAPRAASGPTAGHSKAGAVLLAAIQRYPSGISWSDAAIVAGLTSGNGYFYGGKKYLLTEGLVEERGGLVVALKTDGAPASLAEIIATWSPKLKKPGNLMLEVVADLGSVPPQQLADTLGIKPGNGYWYGGIKAMRAAGLTTDDKNTIALSPLLAAARKAG
jgi:hypothetical protein